MRLFTSLLLLGAAVAVAAEPVWLTDLDAAKAQAVKENKPVLVDFTGSDWCPPCKALHKNVFESKEFAAVASKYVLVELDYPRNKPQEPELKAKNAALSKQFGITGFPTVLLIDAKSGDVFGKTVGFGGQSAKEYLEKLASFKNTPEGRAALVKEQKSSADRSAAQPGSAQQLVLAPEQQSLPRRLMRAPRARPRRRGSQQFVAVAQQAGSAAQQAGSAAAQPAEAPQDGSAAAQAGSAAQLGPQSQLVRPRRPRPAAEAESAAKKPTIRSTAPIMTIEGKRFMKLSLLRKSNRVTACEQTATRFMAACGTTADPD